MLYADIQPDICGEGGTQLFLLSDSRHNRQKGKTMLYSTETELFLNDYKPLPTRVTLSNSDLLVLSDNLVAAAENAFLYGSDLLLDKLLQDIQAIQAEQEKRKGERVQ